MNVLQRPAPKYKENSRSSSDGLLPAPADSAAAALTEPPSDRLSSSSLDGARAISPATKDLSGRGATLTRREKTMPP